MKKYLAACLFLVVLPACSAPGVLKPKVVAVGCAVAESACSYLDAFCGVSQLGEGLTSGGDSSTP